MKISDVLNEMTSAGAVATVAQPMGKMIRRNPKKRKKTNERELSKGEIKQRDKYADDLPDSEFKKRYGDDWEAVKYGTATNMAKKKKVKESQQLDEYRATNILGFMSGLRKHPEVEKIVDIVSQADGQTALVRTKDGNAYEVQVRQAGMAQHPGIQKHTKKNESADTGVSREQEDQFHVELDKLVHKFFGHSSDEKEQADEAALVLNRPSDLISMLDSLLDKWKSEKHSQEEMETLLKALGYKVEFDGDRAKLIQEGKGSIRKILSLIIALGGMYGLSDEAKDFVNQIEQNIEAAKNAKPHPGRPDPVSKDAWVRGSDGVMRPPLNLNDSLEESYDDDDAFFEAHGWIEDTLEEAEYQGRKVKLNKPMQGDVKKFKVYVKDPKTGNVKKVNFGDPNSRIKKNNPERRKSFRARHNCDNPGPKTKARYWSCRKW